jgi:small subunit ribosomal protein S16
VVETDRASEFERNRIAVVMIRLARFGARKQPYYRNPRTEPATVDLKQERLAYWRGVGAQMSPTVAKLVAKHPAVAAEPVTA